MVENEKLVEMVQAAQRGDEQGAAALYDTFQQDIYYYIFKIVKDPELAADLTQDTFMDILRKIDTLREPGAFVAWSRQVAYSRCTAHFRKRKELLADEDEDGYSVFDTMEEERTEFIPDAALDQEDLKTTIHAMIDALPQEQRAALIMRYFEEMSVGQIAEIQGVSEGTVKSRLNYGRKAIGKAVEDYEKKNGVKLHCVGVVPLLLWLFAQGGKGTATTATAATATTATAATATTSTAVGTALSTKLVAAGVAVALTIGGITGAVLLRPKDEPVPEQTVQVTEAPVEKSMSWSGYGHAETIVRNKYFEMTLTEFTENTVSGHLNTSQDYEIWYSTDFTGTGAVAENGTIHYTLECAVPVDGKTNTQADLFYNPETEQMHFNNSYFYEAVMDRWPLDPGEMISQKETWTGIGNCDGCGQDDHQFILEIENMTQISAEGRITILVDGQVENTGTFTARGYVDEYGSWMEAILDEPWPAPHYPEYPTKTFLLEYSRETDVLNFWALWFDAELNRT